MTPEERNLRLDICNKLKEKVSCTMNVNSFQISYQMNSAGIAFKARIESEAATRKCQQ